MAASPCSMSGTSALPKPSWKPCCRVKAVRSVSNRFEFTLGVPSRPRAWRRFDRPWRPRITRLCSSAPAFRSNARRHLNFLFGAHGQAFYAIGLRDQHAFMGGLRLGLEARTSPANVGVTANLFASGGGFHQSASESVVLLRASPPPSRTSLYGEVGGGLSVHTPMGLGRFGGSRRHRRSGRARVLQRSKRFELVAAWSHHRYQPVMRRWTFPREARVEIHLPHLPSSRRKPGPMVQRDGPTTFTRIVGSRLSPG